MTRLKTTKLSLTGAVSLLALTFTAGNAYAQETEFDIEAQPLAKALLAFNEQSGLTVAAPRDLVEGKSAPAVRGEMEPEEALDKILFGSGLKSNEVPTGAYTITLASADATEPSPAPFRVAQLDQEDDTRKIGARDEGDEESVQDVIIVTGSNIRGSQNLSSPIFSFNRDDIDLTGATTAQEFIRTLPQNLDFGENSADGLAGPPVGAGGAVAGVNIRGLGEAATLTLVNGRRLAGGGGAGDFVDISLIPLSAVERVNVLTDGASAIYGADAVAGVVNFILRDDYDGAETRLQYRNVTDGDAHHFNASQTLGTAWGSGSILGVYEYYEMDNLDANDRSFTADAPDPTDLLPQQRRHSVFINGKQEFSGAIEIFATGAFSDVETDVAQLDFPTAVLQLTTEVTQYAVNGGARINLPNDWNIEIGGGYSRNDTDSLRNIVGGASSAVEAKSDLWTADVLANGKIIDLPGGALRLAVGAQYRKESFDQDVIPTFIAEPIAIDQDATAVFGEAFIPLIGERNRRAGVYAFEITAAGRFEDFSDFGSTTNPKFGVRYAPTSDFSLRASYGESFQTPGFQELGSDNFVSVAPGVFFPQPPGTTPPFPGVIFLSGGNPNLGPEESVAWTTGFDYQPESLDGFELNVTYFAIDFEERIGTPGQSFLTLFVTPEGFGDALTFNPDPASVSALFTNPTISNPFSVLESDVGAILDARFQNLAATEIRGLDITASYTKQTDIGLLSFGFNGSRLFDFIEQAGPTSDAVQALGTFNNPVDLRFRTSIGWNQSGFNVVAFVNYVDDYTNTTVTPEEAIDSWTTVDLNLSYDASFNFDDSALKGTVFRLNIQNLFDEAPPFVSRSSPFTALNFDGVNANALGRNISFSITKSW